ncbi:DNA translocase FtsK [Acinetobacter radioresistens]
MDISEEDYQKAVAVVRKCLSGSVSNLQRKLYWGYGRAASAIDRMQDEFIVSPMSASGRRDVYPEETHELWKELQAAKAQAVPDQLDVNSILHDIDCYFDNGLSNTERAANNLLQSIYEKLGGEVKAQEQDHA